MTFPIETQKAQVNRESAQMLNKRLSSSDYTHTCMDTQLCTPNRHYPLVFKKTWNIHKDKADRIAKNPQSAPHVQCHTRASLFYCVSLHPAAQVLPFFKLNVSGSSACIKQVRWLIFLTAFALFMSRGHVLVFLAVFPTCSSLLYLLRSSLIRDP